MSLNSTPNGERVHIGIFGRRNAGKSSLINALTNQNLSIVSDVAGTTTDPVSKAMEILPLGPVLITDTAGIDDSGKLGEFRVNKTYDVLRKIDIAILVISVEDNLSSYERDLLKEINERKLPYIICINKVDIASSSLNSIEEKLDKEIKDKNFIFVSARTGLNINDLREKLASLNNYENEKKLISDLVEKGDTVVLVVPIDESAPKGRLILPQQQVIRDLLEVSATVVVTQDTDLSETLEKLKDKPKAVVTDSQAFAKVSKIVPEDVYLTSFSILMSRYKGDLNWQVEGARAIDKLRDGSIVLISEGCTHHRQCADIGTVKLPKWISEYTKKDITFEFTSGGEFPRNLEKYDLIVHCGGCTLNEKEMKYRIDSAKRAGIPITNYGVLISYINGILERSLLLLTSKDK